MIPAGWYLSHTGGGCSALRRDLAPMLTCDGTAEVYALLTDGEDTHTAPSDLLRPVMVGLYCDDDQRDTFEGTFSECLAWLDRAIGGAS